MDASLRWHDKSKKLARQIFGMMSAPLPTKGFYALWSG